MRLDIRFRRPLSRLQVAGLAAAALLLPGCATSAGSAAATEAASPKSVRQAIEAAYERNRQALLSRDPAAVLALRTDDFHVITPDGATHGAQEMADFTRNLLANVERWDALSFGVETIARQGAEVSADVRQHSKRLMRRGEGKTQLVENWVIQRETWVETPQGWKIRRVDNIRDQRVLLDGVPRQ